MGKHITDTFEVQVQLESNQDYVPTLSIETTFALTDEGPVAVRLHKITEISTDDYVSDSLILTQNEIYAIRYAVADAIERKYWSGEYTCIRAS